MWISAGALAIGLIESFLWGTYVALVFVPIHNVLYRRWASQSAGGPGVGSRSPW